MPKQDTNIFSKLGFHLKPGGKSATQILPWTAIDGEIESLCIIEVAHACEDIGDKA